MIATKQALWELNYRFEPKRKRGEEMNQSFGLLKPDCLERGIQEDIFKMIRSFDLKIIKNEKGTAKRKKT